MSLNKKGTEWATPEGIIELLLIVFLGLVFLYFVIFKLRGSVSP